MTESYKKGNTFRFVSLVNTAPVALVLSEPYMSRKLGKLCILIHTAGNGIHETLAVKHDGEITY